MKIQEIMNRDPEFVEPETPLQVAARRLESMDVNSLSMCANGKLIGRITVRDITMRAVTEDNNPADLKAADVMREELIFCYADQEVEEAAQLMDEHGIPRLPVLERESESLVGEVILNDIPTENGNDDSSDETIEGNSETTPSQT